MVGVGTMGVLPGAWLPVMFSTGVPLPESSRTGSGVPVSLSSLLASPTTLPGTLPDKLAAASLACCALD